MVEQATGKQGYKKANLAMPKRDTNSLNLVGMRVGFLEVLEKTEYRIGTSVAWRCRCVCGRDDYLVGANALKAKKRSSCGCMTKTIISAARTTHGHTDSPTWKSWKSMLDRCNLEAHKSFKDYGGRGVTVCDRWADFSAFLADMGARPAGTTLGRINNEFGYEPGNCQWETAKQQARNRRSSRLISVRGVSKTIAEWAEISGIRPDTIWHRLNSGWSDEKAVTHSTGTPVNIDFIVRGGKRYARYRLEVA